MRAESEKKIIKLIGSEQGRREAFALIMELYTKPLYWHIRRLVVSHEESEDVMQETFINIYRALAGFKGESSIKTWIYRIATNEAIRACTKRRVETSSYDENQRLIDLFESEPEIDLLSAEALLQRAIIELPERQRVVFNLRYFDELSYEQIAKITDSSVATLKTSYHYAKKKIEEYLKTTIEL